MWGKNKASVNLNILHIWGSIWRLVRGHNCGTDYISMNMDGNTPKTDVYPGCITMNEFSSSMRRSTTQRNNTWRQFQWVWLHFQRSRSVQLCAKYSQIRKCYIQPLPSVLKDKKYLKKFPLRCLLGRKLKFWSVAPNSCCLVLSHVMLFWTWSCALFPKTPAKCQFVLVVKIRE